MPRILIALLFAAAQLHTAPPAPPASADVQPLAAKTFNIVMRRFQYDITPSPFVVNRGDSVTINLSVADDGDGAGHGFLLASYSENLNILKPPQKLTIQFTAHTAGTFEFFCTQVCGVGHGNMFGTFIVNEAFPPPVISSVSPLRGSTKGHTDVVIRGSGFQENATVRFGTVNALDVDFDAATQLVAETPPHAAGVVNVVVTNPDGQSGTRTNAYEFVEPEPQVLSVSPSAGTTAGGTPITIQGVDFKSGATAKIGSRPALSVVFVDAQTLTAITPLGPADVATNRAEDVTVTNPDTRNGKKDNAFSWQRGTASIASLSPQSSVVSGGTRVTITGTGFTTALASSVVFGGAAATDVQVIDAVTMTAVAPPHAAGVVNVELHVGADLATAPAAFTYLPPGPKRRSVKK